MPQKSFSLSQSLTGFLIHLKASSYSPNTIELYEWAINRLISFTGDLQMKQITRQELDRFMAAQYDAGYMPASIDNFWKGLRTFFAWAYTELNIPRPDLELKRPRYAPTPIKPLTEEEIKALLKATERTKLAESSRRKSWSQERPTHLRDRALILFLLDTGCRVGECCRLCIQDLNLDNGEVSVSPYQTGRKSKGRTVYLGSAARKALWKYLASKPEKFRPTDHIFTGAENKPLDEYAIKKLVARLGERAGTSHVYPHRFRHTFAIQYLRNGGDVFTLQRLLGHSTLEMVKRYLAISGSDDQNVHRRASPVDNWRL